MKIRKPYRGTKTVPPSQFSRIRNFPDGFSTRIMHPEGRGSRLSPLAFCVYSTACMKLITDTAALALFCERQARAEFVTVDTEFMRDRTYWPDLCRVQLAGPEEAAAIDPLATASIWPRSSGSFSRRRSSRSSTR